MEDITWGQFGRCRTNEHPGMVVPSRTWSIRNDVAFPLSYLAAKMIVIWWAGGTSLKADAPDA